MNLPRVPRKIRWLFLFLLASLAIVIFTLFFGSRYLYANPLFQTWVKYQITSDTKGEFQFQDIKGGFVSAKLKDLSLNLKDSPFNVQEVKTPEMRASFAWIPLLRNKLEIRSLAMIGGELKIRLQGGKLENCSLPVSPSFELKNGTVTIENISGWKLLLQECDLEAEQKGSGAEFSIKGHIASKKAEIGGLKLRKIEGNFRLQNGLLQVENLKAELPGGSRLKCSGSCALEGKPVTEIEMSLDVSDIKTLLQAVDFSGKVSGEADIKLKAKGLFTPSAKSLQGEGSASLSKIDPDLPLPKLPAYNDAPILQRVQELDNLAGKASFQLVQNKISITQLNLKNKDVQITGTALIGYDRSLSSQFLFVGNKTVAEEIPAVARNSFQRDKDGNVSIPFQLKPDTRNPEIDLGDLVGQVMKGMNPFNMFK